MTPLAIIAKEAGCKVTGSDIEEEFITDAALKKAGIIPYAGFSTEHINNPDLVITTGAHNGFDNVEVKRAKELGFEVVTAGEALGLFMDGKIFNRSFFGISIAGTHGKTTTTGMVATILKECRLDPTYVIGTGNVGSLGSPGHLGRGKHFVAEADEYATEPRYDKTPRFLWQHPKIAVITNIEYDHPDVYASLDEVSQSFKKFVNQLPDNGLLIACGDDREIRKIITEYKKPVITYGFLPDNTYILTKVNISGENTFFRVSGYGRDLEEFMLSVIGEHNALNALSAFITAIEAGVPIEKARTALRSFKGSQRRLEFVGELTTGAKVYDDYAHHPTEIKKTLLALRGQYPKSKIICIFQPHTYSRTKKLFTDFLRSFEHADKVVVTDIYASLREPVDHAISSKILAEALGEHCKDVVYLPRLTDIINFINEAKFRSNTILVTMGAGDIYKINNSLKFIT